MFVWNFTLLICFPPIFLLIIVFLLSLLSLWNCKWSLPFDLLQASHHSYIFLFFFIWIIWKKWQNLFLEDIKIFFFLENKGFNSIHWTRASNLRRRFSVVNANCCTAFSLKKGSVGGAGGSAMYVNIKINSCKLLNETEN